MDGMQPPLVVCNEDHRFMVAEQLQELNIRGTTILLEPEGRNTAPAIAAAAWKLMEKDESATMLVLPADHIIENPAALSEAIGSAISSANSGQLVTFAVPPNFPSTGYGYIKKSDSKDSSGASRVDQFIEKPDRKTAENFLQQGGYFWNSGMFMFRASAFLEELNTYKSDINNRIRTAIKNGAEDLDFFRLSNEPYSDCESISVDYAVMEQSSNVSMIPLDAKWNDIGSWSALWEVGKPDKNGNVTKGDVWIENVSDSYIHSENRMVSAVGVKGLVIVETHDGVMVTSMQNDQDIKKIIYNLEQAGRPEAGLHRKVFRPWGNYDCLDSEERFQVKRIMIKPRQSTSMQRHFRRAEHWIVVSGTAEVTCGDKTFILNENESTYIPLGQQHRLKNPGDVLLELIEVQSGSYLGEDDIERIDDEYGRT